MNWGLLSTEERRELAETIDYFLDFLFFAPAIAVFKETEPERQIERLERKLKQILDQQWDAQTRKALEAALAHLEQLGEPVTTEKLNLVLKTLEYHLGTGMAAGAAQQVAAIVAAAYRAGRKDFAQKLDVKVDLGLVDEEAQKVLQQHTVFWIGNYYTAQLGQTIADTVRLAAVEQGLGRKEVGRLLKGVLGEHFQRADLYWEGLAAHTVTRARNLGAVQSMVEAEVTEYQILAVMDERTSQICREMHGRIFRVERAVELRAALLGASSPEDVKTIAPWPKLEDVRGKATRDLPPGMALPPYHFRCRTTVVPRVRAESAAVTIVQETEPVEVERQRVSQAQKLARDYLESLTPAERAAKLNALAHVSWEERKACGHLRHTELGIADPQALVKAARDTVLKPDRILVFFGRNGHLQYAFARDGTDWRIAIVDADTQEIKTLYGPRKDKWVSLEERINEGKRSHGWVELYWGKKQ